ncbi:MAG: FecR domain-containing protein [Marinifilaceae bacterium]|nr:FecR domain-containing protein [Marinifilaceae bacterium]
MEEEKTPIEDILVRILANQATDDDIDKFSEWMQDEKHREYFKKFKKVWNLSTGYHATEEEIEHGRKRYRQYMEKSRRRYRLIRRITTVAAILLVGIFSLYHSTRDRESIQSIASTPVQTGNDVILMLADGQEVNLSARDTFHLETTACHGVSVQKTGRKEIVYNLASQPDEEEEIELSYNRIVVPAGKRFTIQLSDGTKVWLNAESSLRYPTRFGKGKREVEVQGDVYFEVKKDSSRPFIVAAPEIKTEVLGTAFEVNTYGDHQEVSVTLVEGSVRVQTGKQTTIIKPNQQIVYNTELQQVNIMTVDAAQKVSWKDGILIIRHESFEDIVWKLERWYGVKIKNETGEEFHQSFSGEFDEENIREAIEVLCAHLDIKYTMDKDEIILKK